MSVVDPPVDVLGALAGQRLLAGLRTSTLEALAPQLEWRQYPGAARVMSAGDASDGLGFVVSGRLRALADGAVLGEIGQGEPVGETGPLTGRPRNADVVTVRDTLVAWLSLDGFDAVVEGHPELALALAKHALSRTASELRGRGVPTTVTVLSTSPTLDPETFADRLATLAASTGSTLSVVPDRVEPSEVSARLSALERAGHQVMLSTGAGDHADAGWRVRQADRVWVLVDGASSGGPAAFDRVRRILREVSDGGVTPAVEMIVLHPPSARLPTGTARLLDQLDVVAHHHVRRDDPEHLGRLVRHLQGRSVNLVLSGGGARGHAHLGVHRVLVEAGCPIDTLAGTSFGALIAAQLADGEDTDTLIERNRRWTHARVGTSFSYPPVISIMSIRRALQVFDELFGDRRLEDLWQPCLLAAVDLSTGGLRILQRGPIAEMVRASGSPPGLWPPVPDAHGHLLVDGALIDNLPVHDRRARTPGPVIAVDVSKTSELVVDPKVGRVTGLRDFVRTVRSRSPFPTVPTLLMRSMTLTGAARLREALELSDLVVQPDVSTITLPEHKRAAEAIAAGDAAARAALAANPGLVESWR